MSSIIEGYNYDIFISYRQKDNRGDHWVSEFVEALKTELESTFKEEINVYFDINPHDGLLETHDVNESLKEKLKCLIFIPIISRTYCDPKSFAWEHEFRAFVEMASKDQFGLKVKLANGNVASRVLPIKIHSLDGADIKMCEALIDGHLRGIEFVYEEPGVNRPLSSNDDKDKNQNKTSYKNQINKVANSVREITGSLTGNKTVSPQIPNEKIDNVREIIKRHGTLSPSRGLKKPALIITLIVAVFFTFIIYNNFFSRTYFEKLRSGKDVTLTILPVTNIAGDTSRTSLRVMIQQSLINTLSRTDWIKIKPALNTSIAEGRSPSGKDRNLSRQTGADVAVESIITQVQSGIRLNMNLIAFKPEYIFQTFQVSGKPGDIHQLADSISLMIKDYFEISRSSHELTPDIQRTAITNSFEAYKYEFNALSAFSKHDDLTAIELAKKAIKKDSGFVHAYLLLANLYLMHDRQLFDEVINRLKELPLNEEQSLWLQYFMTGEPTSIKQLLELDEKQPILHRVLGEDYLRKKDNLNAIKHLNRALEIYNEWETKPFWSQFYTALGSAYHKEGMYRKEAKVYRDADRYYPGDPKVMYNRAILYNATNKIDLAEKFYRKAFASNPDNVNLRFGLSKFLINNDRDIAYALEQLDPLIEKFPKDITLLELKGLGLYKQKKYGESLKFLYLGRNQRILEKQSSKAADDLIYEVKVTGGILE